VSSVGKVISDPKQHLHGYVYPDYSQKSVNSDWKRKRDSIILPKNLFRNGKGYLFAVYIDNKEWP